MVSLEFRWGILRDRMLPVQVAQRGLRELLWLAGTAALTGRKHRYYRSLVEGFFEGWVFGRLVSRNDPPACQYRPAVFSRIQRLACTEAVEGFPFTSLTVRGAPLPGRRANGTRRVKLFHAEVIYGKTDRRSIRSSVSGGSIPQCVAQSSAKLSPRNPRLEFSEACTLL